MPRKTNIHASKARGASPQKHNIISYVLDGEAGETRHGGASPLNQLSVRAHSKTKAVSSQPQGAIVAPHGVAGRRNDLKDMSWASISFLMPTKATVHLMM